ncbi:MAG: Membrane-anchored ribosome-binding protein inhibits growth in stationary phase, ElaB/YqjD/DUF883 [Rubritepida sp.]|nr:Membrane-anchored ribosome-binding protein inhibits growth in stationary phase, ElaB/YqjD/DUF883 [Rubritepida sp.]
MASTPKPPYTADTNAELAQLRDKVETLMRDRVTPAIGAVADQAQAAARNASDQVREQADRLSSAVQEKPLTSIGLAMLAGFVLASICRR